MLTAREEQELLCLEELAAHERRYRQLDAFFPDGGPYARHLYPRHLEFFAAGATRRERCFMAANRVGKSSAGLYELVLHLTGQYPPWWHGRRFGHPIQAWAAGDTNLTTRDILQYKLLGRPEAVGTGLLPRDALKSTTKKHAPPDAVESVQVHHCSGGRSHLLLKSYEQGRAAFQGTERDVILLDEEPPLAIQTECTLRTMATGSFGGGMVLLTFTPLLGLSETVLSFMPDGLVPEDQSTGSKYVVQASWADVPHLSVQEQAELLASIPPYQRDARTRGVPVLGAGVIYPVAEEDYLMDDLPLHPSWPRAYALDVGWNRTAALWGAYDREADCWYLYAEHYRSQAEPSIQAAAIRAKGAWIRGVIDPAARGRSQVDGTQLLSTYQDLGLDLAVAQNAVEAGIYQVWERLSTGRLKVFRSLQHFRREMRLYRRDEKGAIIKKDDHLQDCARYLCLSGRAVARVQPVTRQGTPPSSRVAGPAGWRQTFTG